MKCEICVEPLDLEGRRPKLLPCSHTVCLGCLQRLERKCCPQCRKRFTGPPLCLPDNYYLANLLRESAERFSSGNQWWCLDCGSLAAQECKCGHPVVTVKEALRRKIREIQDDLSLVAEDLQEILRELTDGACTIAAAAAVRLLAGRVSANCRLLLSQSGGREAFAAHWEMGSSGNSAGPHDRLLGMLVAVLGAKGLLEARNNADVKEPDSPREEGPTAAVPTIRELDVFEVSRTKRGSCCEAKASLSDAVQHQGVRRLKGLHCGRDAAWSLGLLERAAPHLEELEAWQLLARHVPLLHAMPCLRRLDVTGSDGLCCTKKPPVLPALPSSHTGLEWLCVQDLPRETTLSLLRAHGATLRTLSLFVGTGRGHSAWPETCKNLADFLRCCQLKVLDRLILVRPPDYSHTERTCTQQVEDAEGVLGNNVQISCSICNPTPAF